MAPWLAFVIGIIVGLLVGWLIDLLYRRAPRQPVVSPHDNIPDWALPPATPAPTPELPGVTAASTAAAAAVAGSEAMDVPPGSETAEAELREDHVDWGEISDRVDEVPSEVNPLPPSAPPDDADIPSDDDSGLPASAAETFAPPPSACEGEPPEELD